MQTHSPFRQANDLGSIRERLAMRHGKVVAASLSTSAPGIHAFDIDEHVLRVLQRLGVVVMKADAKTAHDAVMAAADGWAAEDILELQEQIRDLGQTICTPAKALCMSCPLSDICPRGVNNMAALKASLEKPGLADVLTRTPLGHGEVDLCLNGGLQHGVLHEVFSASGHETAATGFVAALATRVAAGKHALWIRQDFSAHEFGELSPIGLLELGFDPARMILLSVANAGDGLRAANDALSCAALGTVVIEIQGSPKRLDLVASRRLTLAATQKSVTAFLLRFGAQPDVSTAETRWRVRAAMSSQRKGDWGYPAFEVSLLRNRHGKTGHWFMEWNCDACIFQNTTADHGTLVSAVANGPVATARTGAASP